MILPMLSRGINHTKHSLPCQWNTLTIAGCSRYLTRNGIRAASSSAGARYTLGHGVSVLQQDLTLNCSFNILLFKGIKL